MTKLDPAQRDAAVVDSFFMARALTFTASVRDEPGACDRPNNGA
jgi:hypothetical protein